MIIQNEFDQYIYHFTKSKTATKHILPSLRLKLSPFNKTNDPKEHRTFGFHIDNLEKINVFDTIKLNNSLINFVNKRCKLTCFSHDYIYKKTLYFGYNLPRMWAQYADKHKGVCFVISQELLKKENSDLIKSDKYFAEVNYEDKIEYPDFKENEYLENNNKYFETFVEKNLANLFLTKFIDSQTEHETRLIHVGTKKYCCIKNSLKGIILGRYIDKPSIDLIKNYLPNNVWIGKIYYFDGRLHLGPLVDEEWGNH